MGINISYICVYKNRPQTFSIEYNYMQQYFPHTKDNHVSVHVIVRLCMSKYEYSSVLFNLVLQDMIN
jgi:hypothetical protein